ncbi:ethanolamine ammonia-lyase subunit EutC [Chryseomicrobium palamuruense]|uniref:Ethanolamine ammonia-lyase small subunit n=1 Tax=Chryseomicrobium palamuruense TaxID=682973 RepID=A0ABV8UXI3_9BACL
MDLEKIVKQIIDEVMRNQESTFIPKSDERSKRTVHFPEEFEMGVENPYKEEAIRHAQSITPARIGIGRAGSRMKTQSYLQFRIDHAAAQDAVRKDVNPEVIEALDLPILETRAESLKNYLMDLDAGRKLSDRSKEWLQKNGEKDVQVQILVCDGLSSSAVEANVGDLLPALTQGLLLKNIKVGKPLFIKRARVWVQDEVAQLLNAEFVISLIGERPGLNTDESMSAYMVYKPTDKTVEADRTVISNIHKEGLAPVEAGAHLSGLIEKMLQAKSSGVAFARQNNLQDV